MVILLIRHAQAVEDAPGLGDSGRWLTAKGRKAARKVARWLGRSDKRRPTTLWTSPLVRAVQTAEIIAAGVDAEGEVIAVSELTPGRDPGDLVKRLAEAPADGVLALVGHEPSLSLIAGALLGDVGLTGLRKGAVLGLTWDGTAGEPRFLFDPAEKKAKKRFDAPPATVKAEPADEA